MIIVAYNIKLGGRAYRFFPEDDHGPALSFAYARAARIFFAEPSDLVSEQTVAAWIQEREARGDFLTARDLFKE